jgi:hypothetical protein
MMTEQADLSSWMNIMLKNDYLRPLPTNHKINPTTNTTNKIPTHTPALKMPPITSQDDKVIAVANTKSPSKEYCFMSSSFLEIMQMLCRRKSLPIPIAIGISGEGALLPHKT